MICLKDTFWTETVNTSSNPAAGNDIMLIGILISRRAYWIYSKGNDKTGGKSKLHYLEYCCFYLPTFMGYTRRRVPNGMVFLETNLQKNWCKISLLILARLRKRTKHTKKYTVDAYNSWCVRHARAAASSLPKRHAIKPRGILGVQIFLTELWKSALQITS